MKRDFSHLPAWVERSAAGSWRASANMRAMACSAVVMELPSGVFMTSMPRCVAAGTSTLSTPMPARPMTFRLSASSSSAFVTFVAERTARPSYLPMIFLSSSGERPVMTSVSTPRSAKISTARGDRASEIKTLGMASIREGIRTRRRRSGRGGAAQLAIGPVEPGQQRFDIAALDGGAAPDAQPRRRIAMTGDVIGDALGIEHRFEPLHRGALRLDIQALEPVIGDLEADRGPGPDRRIRRQEIDPGRPSHPLRDRREVGFGARHQCLLAADRLGPFEAVDRVLDHEHGGCVDGLGLEDAVAELALRGQAEELRQRPGWRVALEPRHGPRAQRQHAMGSLAAQHLLPGPGDDVELIPGKRHGEGGRGRVADRETLAVRLDPVAVRHTDAGGGAVPGEDDIAVSVDFGEVRNLSVIGAL